MRSLPCLLAFSLLAASALPVQAQTAAPPQEPQLYPYCEPSKDGLTEARMKYDTDRLTNTSADCGFIDRTGKLVIAKKFFWVGPFKEGLAAAVDDKGMLGFLDASGAFAIPPRFDLPRRTDPPEFEGGVAAATTPDGLIGVINRKGDWIVAPSATFLLPTGQGFTISATMENGAPLFTLFDATGKPLRPERFQDVEGPGDDRILVKLNGKYGLIDLKGNWVVKPSLDFSEASTFSEGLASVHNDQGWGFIDTSGKIVIEPRFESANPFRDGIAMVGLADDGGTRFIDRTGAFANDIRLAAGTSYNEGLAPVMTENDPEHPARNNRWFYVDKAGKQVFDLTARFALPFENGLAAVSPEDGSAGVIDKSGKWRLAPMRDINTLSIHILPGPVIQVEPIKYDQPKWLYFDADGKPILPH